LRCPPWCWGRVWAKRKALPATWGREAGVKGTPPPNWSAMFLSSSSSLQALTVGRERRPKKWGRKRREKSA